MTEEELHLLIIPFEDEETNYSFVDKLKGCFNIYSCYNGKIIGDNQIDADEEDYDN